MLTVHGHRIYCEDDRAFHGVKYIAYEMEESAARELFKQAQNDREVDFEDDEHRKFTLVDGENLSYTVVTRDRPSW